MRERLRPIVAIMRASFDADPRRTVLAVTLYALAALGAPIFALGLGALADALGGSASGTQIVVLALALGVTAGASNVVRELAWKVVHLVEERTAHVIDRQVLDLVMSLPGIEHHERPEYLDKFERIRAEHWLLAQAVAIVLSSTSLFVQLIATVVVLVTVEPLLLVLAVFAAPALYANGRAESIRIRAMDRVQPEWRRSDALMNLLTTEGPAKEVRVFGLGPELLRRHDEVSERSYRAEFEARLRGAAWVASGRVIFTLGFVGAIALVVQRVSTGASSVGDLLVAVTVSGQLLAQLGHAAGFVAWMSFALTAVRRYLWLIDYGKEHGLPGDAQAPARLQKGIRLEHVSFAYPGTDRMVLEDVDLDLPAGTTVALIGDNGAGKSTLIKLLTRMYEPTSGRILIDDIPLDTIDPVDWRAHTSAAFQDHARLELTAQHTVGVGDLPQINNRVLVNESVERGGAASDIARLPAQLDTQLGGQWPDGVDLSGGQWQKLALARGMMREPLLLVLDEPTSALDAETEHSLFERFADVAHYRSSDTGTVTMLVSHRFSTVRMADVIVVISAGAIAEMGSHEELIAQGGLYADLYELQARAYR